MNESVRYWTLWLANYYINQFIHQDPLHLSYPREKENQRKMVSK